MDRSKALLWDAQHAIEELVAFLEGHDEGSYLASPMLQAAVERKFQIIGEALAQLSKTNPAMASDIGSLRQIIGFRNILVHGYAVVEQATVYAIARQHLPELSSTIRRLLASS